jgi:hypothetical protein
MSIRPTAVIAAAATALVATLTTGSAASASSPPLATHWSASWTSAMQQPVASSPEMGENDLQWDDEYIDRQSGLALFDAFASKEKTLHANAGNHKEVPRFEADSAVRFLARHLSTAGTSPA